jgi:hypothetical protein
MSERPAAFCAGLVAAIDDRGHKVGDRVYKAARA